MQLASFIFHSNEVKDLSPFPGRKATSFSERFQFDEDIEYPAIVSVNRRMSRSFGSG